MSCLRYMTTVFALISVAFLSQAAVSASAAKPNIVLIQTDDSTLNELPYMPYTEHLLGQEGLTFSRYYVDDSICCPSRASLLTRLYVHNNSVLANQPADAYRPSKAALIGTTTWLCG